MKIKTRFAPSPTGLLHLGSVRTALFNYLIAYKTSGTFLLRVEDTDVTRGHGRYIDALQEDLRWLGLEWHEGVTVGGEHGPYMQSQREQIYRDYFTLLQQQRVAYPCFCTQNELELERKAQLAASRPPRYSGRCYRLNEEEAAMRLVAGTPATLRFHVKERQWVEFDDKVRGPQRFNTDDIGDFVIRRSNGTPAFFFSNALDDALMGITLVVRGEDHLTNTPRQILILKALNLQIPDYAHIALVVGPRGTPLSKREGSRTIRDLRNSGFLALALTNYLARLGHTYSSNALMDLSALAEGLEVSRLHRAPARYDETQLKHWQHEAVRSVAWDQLWQWMDKRVHALVPAKESRAFVETVRPNVTLPNEALEWATTFFSDESFSLSGTAREAIAAAPRAYFDQFLDAYEGCAGDYTSFASKLKKKTGAKGAAAFRPARFALTNKEHGPELIRLLEIMPPERIRNRILNARAAVNNS
ncbi:MAG: glutamate--tRNA ligase [Acidiferrobacterales bacterium]